MVQGLQSTPFRGENSQEFDKFWNWSQKNFSYIQFGLIFQVYFLVLKIRVFIIMKNYLHQARRGVAAKFVWLAVTLATGLFANPTGIFPQDYSWSLPCQEWRAFMRLFSSLKIIHANFSNIEAFMYFMRWLFFFFFFFL